MGLKGPFSVVVLHSNLPPAACNQRLKFGLTPELGMFSLATAELPVSGWVGSDRFRLRTRVRFSNGGSVQVAYGKLRADAAGTAIHIRFAIELLSLIALVMLVALPLVLRFMFQAASLSALATGFLVLVIAYMWIASGVERRRLIEYIEAACGPPRDADIPPQSRV